MISASANSSSPTRAGRTAQSLDYSSLAGDCGISQPTAKARLSIPESGFVAFRPPTVHSNQRKRLVKMLLVETKSSATPSSGLLASARRVSGHLSESHPSRHIFCVCGGNELQQRNNGWLVPWSKLHEPDVAQHLLAQPHQGPATQPWRSISRALFIKSTSAHCFPHPRAPRHMIQPVPTRPAQVGRGAALEQS